MENQHERPTINVQTLLLNSGLNEDCLLEILKYLSVCDLLKICDFDTDTDKSFTQLISKHIIPLKLFDFVEIQSTQRKWSIIRLFETFGHSMTRLKVTLFRTTFNHYLRKVIRYCNPNRVIEIDITFKIDYFEYDYDFTLLEQIRPFLRNLRKLNLQGCSKQLTNAFQFYANDINTVKSLTIDQMGLFRECLGQLPTLAPNITEIHLAHINLGYYMPEFHQLLNTVPNLQKFIYTCYSPSAVTEIGERLVYKYPSLKSFGFLTHCFNFNFVGGVNQFDVLNSLNFLRGFSNLSELEIGADSDCQDAYRILQHVPSIKVFSIWQLKTLVKEPVEIRNIVKAIKGIVINRINLFPVNDHVEIVVNQRQYREFKAIKHIDHFIRLTLNDSERSKIFPRGSTGY